MSKNMQKVGVKLSPQFTFKSSWTILFCFHEESWSQQKLSKNTFTSSNGFSDQIITFCELFYEIFVKALRTS